MQYWELEAGVIGLFFQQKGQAEAILSFRSQIVEVVMGFEQVYCLFYFIFS